MSYQRPKETAAWQSPNREEHVPVVPRPFAEPAHSQVQHPPTPEQQANDAFQQDQFDAFGLELKEKHGTITPEEQERFGVLQAKMAAFWAPRMERGARLGHNIAHIPAYAPDAPEAASPQSPLTIQRYSYAPPTFSSNTQPAAQEFAPQPGAEGVPTGESLASATEVRPNHTGLPDNLKAGVEELSGYSLDDVRVHYNSPQPAQIQALAYTQGTEIHVAPGQEQHLPHEAWHVVQQLQGRVTPTMQLKGVQINDDDALEREADQKGEEAQRKRTATPTPTEAGNTLQRAEQSGVIHQRVVQRVKSKVMTKAEGNIRNDKKEVLAKVPQGAIIDIDEDRTLRFDLGLFSIAADHTWATYEDTDGQVYTGWIRTDIIGTKLAVAKDEAQVDAPIYDMPIRSMPMPIRSMPMPIYGRERHLKDEVIAQEPDDALSDFDHFLAAGKYVEPRGQGRGADMGGGWNFEIERDHNQWNVYVEGGYLVNRNRERITGGGAWVLDGSGQLYGSQKDSEDSFFMRDMDSHQQAGMGISPHWAGEMEVKDGKPTDINNKSGTYALEVEAIYNLLKYLIDNKVITRDDVVSGRVTVHYWKQTGLDREGELRRLFRGQELAPLEDIMDFGRHSAYARSGQEWEDDA